MAVQPEVLREGTFIKMLAGYASVFLLGYVYMIQKHAMWFGEYLVGENYVDWLNTLPDIIAACSTRGHAPRVEDGSKIVGTVVFGKNCIVGHGALVVGPAIFGDNCVIGHASEVARSVFGNESRAAHFNYVGDSVVGSRVNLGAGAKLANARLDKQLVRGREKCGALLGDDVQIGCNAVIDPGVMLDAGVWFAGANIPFTEEPYTRERVRAYFFPRAV